MRQAAILIFAIACKKTDDYQVEPPTPMPNPGVVDAPALAVDAHLIDAAESLSGRVCLITDPRAQTACNTTSANGFTVTLDGHTATTVADGTFVIAMPTGTSLVWHVSGTQLVTSVMPFGAVAAIPAMTIADYTDLQNENGAGVQSTDNGEIFARIVHGGAPLMNAKADSTPGASFGPFYDSTSSLAWNSGLNESTGAAGIAWFPGVAIGNATVSVTPNGGTLLPVPNVPVEAQSITWLVIDTP
jgi:hypothetical protein